MPTAITLPAIKQKPDSLHTAFNPIIFKFVTNDNKIYVEIQGKNDVSARLIKEEMDGVETFELGGIVKEMFCDLKAKINSLALKDGGAFYDYNIFAPYTMTYGTISLLELAGAYIQSFTPLQSLNFYALNAVAQVGEKSSLINQRGTFLTGFERLRKYAGYPLQVCVLAFAGTNYYQTTNIAQQTVQVKDGVYCFMIMDTDGYVSISNAENTELRQILTDNDSRVITDNDGNMLLAQKGTRTQRRMMIENLCTPLNPYYVRWVSDKGGWEYFMFSLRQYTKKELSETNVITPYFEEVEQEESQVKGLFTLLSAEGEQSVVVGCEDMSEKDFDCVSGILFSPNIQHYNLSEDTWERLYIKEASVEKDNAESRQSIELTLWKSKRLMQL